MKTTIKKRGDTFVVSVDGKLEIEKQNPLREELQHLIQISRSSSSSKIIFNFENLSFVGSSGISAFVQILKEFNESAPSRPRYCHVGSEFQKIFRAFDETGSFDIHDSFEQARQSIENHVGEALGNLPTFKKPMDH